MMRPWAAAPRRDRRFPGRSADRRHRAGRGLPHRRPDRPARLHGRARRREPGHGALHDRRPRRRPQHRRLPRPDRHADRRGRHRHPERARGPAAGVVGAQRPRSARGACAPSAPARSSWARPACSRAGAPRPTGRAATCSREQYPSVTVEPDQIYVRDGDLYTSAGVTAGHGPRARAGRGRPRPRDGARGRRAGSCMFVKRPGGQSQFSAQLAAQTAEREPLRELQDWIAGNLDADLSVPALAERAHMSERNFARAFRKELGMTPGRLRRDRSCRGCAHRARVGGHAGRGRRPRQRLRNGRDDAPRIPPPPRRRSRRLPRPLQVNASRLTKEASHADRHPAVRPLHRPRRHRALRGALAHPRRRPEVPRHRGRSLQDRQRDAHDPGRGIARRHAAPRHPVRSRRMGHARGDVRRAPGRLDPRRARDHASGRRRSAPGRCCWAPPGSSTASTRRRTGSSSRRCARWARTRPSTAWWSRARSSPPPACPRGSTWR